MSLSYSSFGKGSNQLRRSQTGEIVVAFRHGFRTPKRFNASKPTA
jgi:hypothetical protein